MTMTGILVVLVVALLVTKPSDLPSIIKYIKTLMGYLRQIQSEFMAYFDQFDDADEMNQYIEKISALGVKYEGNYDLQSIKSYYLRLIKTKAIKNE